jgi:hypothetical protein
MADFLQLVSSLREQMNATLSRSDALKPLAWLVGILATATILGLFAKASEWILVAFVVALMSSIALYAAAYTFCLFADRDALRSEKYSLQKMAIEHGIYGDNLVGVITPKAGGEKLIESFSGDKTKTEGGA